jgi:pSer/pThr/pTyr-binding forkhead associated (FHA) protein
VQLKLIVVGGARSGDEVYVSVPKFIIGRDRDCHLRCNSDVVSRHHCALIVEENYIAVIDFSSKNGIYVDGVRVLREQELHTGNLLSVGPLQFLVQLSGVPLDGSVRGHTQENSTGKAQRIRHPEEIVDDWSDALDPQQMHDASPGDPQVPQKNDAQQSVSSKAVLPGKSQAELKEGDCASQASALKDRAPEEDTEIARSVDTQTAAIDALRKIGKRTPKKI